MIKLLFYTIGIAENINPLTSHLFVLIDTCAGKPMKFNVSVEIDLVEVFSYSKQLFHLLYHDGVTLAVASLYFSLI